MKKKKMDGLMTTMVLPESGAFFNLAPGVVENVFEEDPFALDLCAAVSGVRDLADEERAFQVSGEVSGEESGEASGEVFSAASLESAAAFLDGFNEIEAEWDELRAKRPKPMEALSARPEKMQEADLLSARPGTMQEADLLSAQRIRPGKMQEADLLISAAMRRNGISELNLYCPKLSHHVTVVLLTQATQYTFKDTVYTSVLEFYLNGRKYASLTLAARDLKMLKQSEKKGTVFVAGCPDAGVTANIWTLLLLDRTPLGVYCGRTCGAKTPMYDANARALAAARDAAKARAANARAAKGVAAKGAKKDPEQDPEQGHVILL